MGRLNFRKGSDVRSVDDADSAAIATLTRRGYQPETPAQAAATGVEQGRLDTVAGTAGALEASGQKYIDALTFGLSTAAQAQDPAERERLQLLEQAHPTASTIGTVGGLATQALVLPGGEGVGAGRLALEGAAYGAADSMGHYAAQAAMADRPVSAQGFVSSGLWGAGVGGAAGGVIGIAHSAASRARALFPAAELTDDAVRAADHKAAVELDGALADTDQLVNQADALARDAREAATSADPVLAAEADAAKAAAAPAADPIAAAGQAEAAANARAADLRAQRAGVRADREQLALEREQARLEKAKAPRGRRGKAAKEPAAPATPGDQVVDAEIVDAAPAPADAGGIPGLEETAQRMAGGEDFGALQAEAAADRAISGRGSRAARLKAKADALRRARQGVAEAIRPAEGSVDAWIAARRAEHDAWREAKVAAGELSPLADVVHDPGAGAGDILRAKVGAEGRTGGARAESSRLRRQFTDEELIAQSKERPTWIAPNPYGEAPLSGEVARHPWLAADERISSRTALAEQILAGQVDPATLQIEELIQREVTDPITGEITAGGVTTARRAATPDDILEAVRRSPSAAKMADALEARLGRSPTPATDSMALVRRPPTELAKVATGGGWQATAWPGLEIQSEVDLADRIGALERAEHDLVQEIGPGSALIPTGSARRAEGVAAAMAEAADAKTLGTMQRARAAAEAGVDDVAKATATGGLLGKVQDVAGVLDLLSELNIPGLPRPRDIPVIGPLLSLYLKARTVGKVWRKFGGKIPGSIETEVAGRAAKARDRLSSIVKRSLDVAAGATRAAARPVPRATEVLARSLFDDGRGPRRRDQGDEATHWRRRVDEVIAGSDPTTVANAVMRRVPTADPLLLKEITATVERKMAVLANAMPRPPALAAIGGKRDAWHPTQAQLTRFARVIRAVEDPHDVLEDAIDGGATPEQIDAIATVYPDLFAQAQAELVSLAMERTDIPYRRRVWLSTMWRVPLDPTLSPEFIAAMAAVRQPAAPPATAGPAAGPAPPTPGTAGPVNLSRGTLLPEQRP